MIINQKLCAHFCKKWENLKENIHFFSQESRQQLIRKENCCNQPNHIRESSLIEALSKFKQPVCSRETFVFCAVETRCDSLVFIILPYVDFTISYNFTLDYLLQLKFFLFIKLKFIQQLTTWPQFTFVTYFWQTTTYFRQSLGRLSYDNVTAVAWPIAERRIGHRKSSSVLSVRFPVLHWRSR